MSNELDSGQTRWTVFCRVVDNFGDIGVCWRLSRCLALHNGISVTLVVDDIGTLRLLCPELPPENDEILFDGVIVVPWSEASDMPDLGDVVIEGFACELPGVLMERMSRQVRPPLWINLEYLSAEPWVEGCHLMRSPHPTLPLLKHFFFPGFSAATGGLLREPDLFSRRDLFQSDSAVRSRFLFDHGCGELSPRGLLVSLFAYEQPAVSELFGAWAESAQPVTVLVPTGRVLNDVADFFGSRVPAVGDRLERGALTVVVLPFLTQDDYDRLLWCCDLNFVRGEDSFVRAQWAARPFVWQAYRQDEGVHIVKLDAFLERFCTGLEPQTREAVVAFWHSWNDGTMSHRSWEAFANSLHIFRKHCEQWVVSQGELNDLATSLIEFSKKRV